MYEFIDLLNEAYAFFQRNWIICSGLTIVMGSLIMYLFGYFDREKAHVNQEDHEYEDTLIDAVHMVLLKTIPGICTNQFTLDDSTKNTAGEWVTVHRTKGEPDFTIVVKYESIGKRVRVLEVEGTGDLGKLIECTWVAKKVIKK